MNQKPANSPGDQAQQHRIAAPKDTCGARESGYQEEQNDPVWGLLDKASSHEPSAMFARNVIRETRLSQNQERNQDRNLGSRILAILNPTRLALGAAACACATVTYHMWPSPTQPNSPYPVASETASEPSTALTELVIEESLEAAAEDPSIFTRDEVVAMIGF